MDMRDMLHVIAKANRLGLMGTDFLNDYGVSAAISAYNGIGPEFFPKAVRERVTRFLGLFELPAVIHDCRFERSDGTRKSFDYANNEFYVNCHKCAKDAYPWWSWKRYRAYAVIDAMYEFVSGGNGWRAWTEAEAREKLSR